MALVQRITRLSALIGLSGFAKTLAEDLDVCEGFACDELEVPVTSLLQVGADSSSVSRLVKSKAKPPIWYGKNGDLLRTGLSPFSAPFNLTDGPSWSWTPEKSGRVSATPLIDGDGDLYFSVCKPPHIRKYSPNGTMLWEHKEPWGALVPTLPGVGILLGNSMISLTTAGQVFALDLMTGAQVWRSQASQTAGSDTWSMAGADGIVVVPVTDFAHENMFGGNSYVKGLSAYGGEVLWTFTPDTTIYNFLAPITSDGFLFFADAIGTPYKLNLKDGTLLWKGTKSPVAALSTGGLVAGPNQVLYVTGNTADSPQFPGSGGGYIAAYAMKDGELLFQKPTEGHLLANAGAAIGPLKANGPLAVVIGTGKNPEMPGQPVYPPRDRKVQANDAKTGDLLWVYDMPPFTAGVAAGDGTRPMWTICLPDSFSNPTIGADGTVYIGNEDGLFDAIKDLDGDGHIQPEKGEVSSFDTKWGFQGTAAISPGLVAAASCGSFLVWNK